MYDERICMSSGLVCTHTHSHISNISKPPRYYNRNHFTAQLTVTFKLTLKCTKSNAKKWDLLSVQCRCSLCLLVSIFVLSVFAKLLACDEMLYLLSINFTAFGRLDFNLLIKRGWLGIVRNNNGNQHKNNKTMMLSCCTKSQPQIHITYSIHNIDA